MDMKQLDPEVIDVADLWVCSNEKVWEEALFFWKYTAANRLASTRKHLKRYKSEHALDELDSLGIVVCLDNGGEAP